MDPGYLAVAHRIIEFVPYCLDDTHFWLIRFVFNTSVNDGL